MGNAMETPMHQTLLLQDVSIGRATYYTSPEPQIPDKQYSGSSEIPNSEGRKCRMDPTWEIPGGLGTRDC